MYNEILITTERPRHLVSRQKEMQKIRGAIEAAGNECRLVLLEGFGGLGKTRMLEEVLRRLGHKAARQIYGLPRSEDDWTHLERPVAVCDLFDFADIRLHTRTYFISELGDPANWSEKLKFNQYILAREQWRRLTDFGAAYTLVQDAETKAEEAFWRDYAYAAESQRLVVLLDTTEQLAINSSEWLLERNLLQTKDLVFNTQQWLIEQIQVGKFANTTIIIAGRHEEGEPFFRALKEMAADINSPPLSIYLPAFDADETRTYFLALQEDVQATENQELIERLEPVLDDLLKDEDRLRVFWLYTGGQPVRLSLYIDLLIEGLVIPDALLDSFAEAQQRTSSDGLTETEALKVVRREIEKEFVDLLFRSGGSQRAQILQLLVRTPRGLNAEQIHFVLDSPPETLASNWVQNDARIAEIKATLANLQRLSIVKQKPGDRIGLQDEVYRIYAERMSDEETTRQDEKKARQILYTQLSDWASYQMEEQERKRETYIREDLRRIKVERPSNILSTRLPQPSPIEQNKRQQVAENLLENLLEYLHYLLLLNPETHINNTYFELTFGVPRSNYDETVTTLLQSEMLRVIRDPYALRFVDFESRDVMKKWGETGWDVLRRTAQIDDATKWIIRLYLRKQYHAAIQLADAIEQEAAKLENKRDRHGWTHTLSHADRVCWREIAQIYLGENISTAVTNLEEMAEQLEQLLRADMKTLVFPERQEFGFAGHPAESRLRYLIAVIYTNLGYAYVNQGDYHHAVKAYTASHKAMRELPPASLTLKAMVRNNLSRPLVEMGKKRSLRICQDGLEIRIKEGALIPIALSYNTVALIYNDIRQPQEALDASIRALAIAQYANDPRTIGLALLQVGEALRRIAVNPVLLTAQDSAEDVYREGERALQQAHEIFADPKSPVSGEQVRRVEAAIELGSLYRDWVAHAVTESTPLEIIEQRRENALFYLEEAIELAHNLKLAHLELDARVNVSWTHFYTGNFDKALQTLHEAEISIPQITKLRLGKKPPHPLEHPNHYFKQLSKIQNLYGHIASRRFIEGVKEITARNPHLSRSERQRLVHNDPQLNIYLEKSASSYVQAAAYAQLFAPTSIQLSIVYDDLYDFLKKMNQTEMSDFYRYEQQAREQYRIGEMTIENFGDVEEFLRDCFGDYYSTETAVPKETL